MENNIDSTWREMIKENIFQYISNIDYNHPDFKLLEFKQQLKNIIGMEPAVKIKWNTTESINELKRAAGATDYKEIIDKVEKIDITFVDEDNKPISLVFLL